MCFTKLNTDDQAKTAEQDIQCYKMLRPDLMSPFQYHHYKQGELVESIIEEEDGDIEDGLHSCKSLDDATSYRDGACEPHCPIFEFTIPKGAQYYENHTEYVSDKIILKSSEPVMPAEYEEDEDEEYEETTEEV